MSKDYIYNKPQNLRTTLNDVSYTPAYHPSFGSCFIAVVDCEDKCAGNWDREKQYCGIVTKMDDVNEIQILMAHGSKTNSLRQWLNQ
jgi:hypothetical protein